MQVWLIIMICKFAMLCYASLPCYDMQVYHVMLCKFEMQVRHMICKYVMQVWDDHFVHVIMLCKLILSI